MPRVGWKPNIPRPECAHGTPRFRYCPECTEEGVKDELSDFFFAFYYNDETGRCGLCHNSGNIVLPNGFFKCICPNGRGQI